MQPVQLRQLELQQTKQLKPKLVAQEVLEPLHQELAQQELLLSENESIMMLKPTIPKIEGRGNPTNCDYRVEKVNIVS